MLHEGRPTIFLFHFPRISYVCRMFFFLGLEMAGVLVRRGSKCAHCLYATKYDVCVSTVAPTPINAPGTLKRHATKTQDDTKHHWESG